MTKPKRKRKPKQKPPTVAAMRRLVKKVSELEYANKQLAELANSKTVDLSKAQRLASELETQTNNVETLRQSRGELLQELANLNAEKLSTSKLLAKTSKNIYEMKIHQKGFEDCIKLTIGALLSTSKLSK